MYSCRDSASSVAYPTHTADPKVGSYTQKDQMVARSNHSADLAKPQATPEPSSPRVYKHTVDPTNCCADPTDCCHAQPTTARHGSSAASCSPKQLRAHPTKPTPTAIRAGGSASGAPTRGTAPWQTTPHHHRLPKTRCRADFQPL